MVREPGLTLNVTLVASVRLRGRERALKKVLFLNVSGEKSTGVFVVERLRRLTDS